MNIIKLSCANCNGNTDVKITDGQKFLFCPYCGQKYMVDDGKIYIEINRTERKIDEARIKEAEVREKIRLKELEMEETKRKKKTIGKIFKVLFTILLGLIGGLMLLIGLIGGETSGNPDSSFYWVALIGMFVFVGIWGMWSKK